MTSQNEKPVVNVHRWVALILLVLGFSQPTLGQVGTSLVVAFPDLPAFVDPIDLESDPRDDDRLILAEQGGLIYDFDIVAPTPRVILDLSEKVFEEEGEGGFQGFTFAPDFSDSKLIYVHYLTGDEADPDGTRRSVISRFTMLESGIVDPTSEVIIIEIGQLQEFHNGGKILFGPDDFLYIPLGDGGLNGAPNGQNRSTLLGSVLRIDPVQPGEQIRGGVNYSIPPDNPFVGNKEGWREEIWAWGMRNPFRSSFDADGNLWVGDVGNVLWEEIDIIERGGNYGWNIYEAFLCRNEPCEDDESLRFPIHAYSHDISSGGFAVIGGEVYEGDYNPNYTGWYVFADAWTNRIWALDPDNASDVDLLVDIGTGPPRVVDFAQDSAGQLYIVGYTSGLIYDVMASFPVANEPFSVPDPTLSVNVFPNPAHSSATLDISIPQGGRMRCSVVDLLGREVLRLFDGHVQHEYRSQIAIDLSSLSAGTYLVKLETDSVVETRRLIHLR